MNGRRNLFLTKQTVNESVNESVQDNINFLETLLATLSQAKEALATYRPPQVHQGIDFYEEITKFEISLIRQALKHTQGNQQRAASLLKLKPSTLNNKIKTFKINWKLTK